MRHPECCAEDWRPGQKLRSAPGLVGLLRRKLVHALLRKRPGVCDALASAGVGWHAGLGTVDAAGGTAPSGEVAGTSFGLFHVWFDACWDAGCVCWHPFIAHTCANWQLSDLHVPVWNLRQIGFPLCEVAQAFFGLSFSLAFAAVRIFAAGWRAVWDSVGPV